MQTETLLSDTMSFADVLREMDIDFLVSGEYGITVEDAAKLIKNNYFLFLDVRTREEQEHLAFPFAMHIPIDELPDRIGELPRNRFIITFCLTGFRAAMAYAFLRTQGFDEVKALKGRLDNLAGAMTPARFYRLAP